MAAGRERRTGDSHRSEEHTSELQSHVNLVCRLLLEKKKHRAYIARPVTVAALGRERRSEPSLPKPRFSTPCIPYPPIDRTSRRAALTRLVACCCQS